MRIFVTSIDISLPVKMLGTRGFLQEHLFVCREAFLGIFVAKVIVNLTRFAEYL